MKKSIVAIVGAVVIVTAGWFMLGHPFRRIPTVSFIGYTDSSNGIVVARFVMRVPESCPYVCLQQPEASVVTKGSVSVGTLTHPGETIFAVPVRQSSEAWHFKLRFWKGDDVSKMNELLRQKPDSVVDVLVPPK